MCIDRCVTDLVIAKGFLEIICVILPFQMIKMTAEEVRHRAQNRSPVSGRVRRFQVSLISGALERDNFEVSTVLSQTSKIALPCEIVTYLQS